MNWKNWPYWIKVISIGVLVFIAVLIIDKQNLFTYGFRQQHPYLANVNRIVSTVPSIGSVILLPTFCQPVITPQGSSSCIETFELIYYTLKFIEVVLFISILGWLYSKIKNRHKIIN